MKTKKSLLTGILSLIVITLFCRNSDEFLIGAYVNNKNLDFWINMQGHIYKSLQDGGFNACMSSAVYDADSQSVEKILDPMEDYQLDCILEDYVFDPALPAIGARTLTMGNYFRFEAEYCDSASVSINDYKHPDSFFYMSPNDRSARVGGRNRDTEKGFSNGYYWKVKNGQAGYAFQDLMYKWKDKGKDFYSRIGAEFRFPYNGLRNAGVHGNGSADYTIFNDNELYITYAFKCEEIDELPDDTVLAAISLTFKGATTATKTSSVIPHIAHTIVCDTTYITKKSYTMSETTPAGLHLIRVAVSLSSLNASGNLIKNTYWNKSLVNLNPNMLWYGKGTLKLDYIEFKDKFFQDYTSNEAVLSRIRRFESNDVPYLYGSDEPSQGQFESFRLVTRYLEKNSANPTLIAAIHQFNGQIQRTGTEPYRHRNVFYDIVKPKAMEIDEYPFTNDCSPDWMNPQALTNENALFVQKYIDGVCSEYHYYKNYCLPETRLIFVPQTSGVWDPVNKWWQYLMPPDKVAKSLQFLPLCYQADGIIDYKFFERNINEIALVNKLDTSKNYGKTKQYEAVKAANLKIRKYGPLTKKLTWLGAGTLMTTSPAGLNISKAFLKSLYVPKIISSKMYQGYIQTGLYTNDAGTDPSIMLVNRRATIAPKNLSRITPHTYPSDPDSLLNTFNNLCKDAPPQKVRFVANAAAHSRFGTHIGLIDPYDGKVYIPTGKNIDVELEPGDGKLLQMTGTLPLVVKANSVLRSAGYIQGSVLIKNGAQVVFDSTSDVKISPDTEITIAYGASLIIKGSLDIGAGTHIKNYGSLTIDETRCKMGTGATIEQLETGWMQKFLRKIRLG